MEPQGSDGECEPRHAGAWLGNSDPCHLAMQRRNEWQRAREVG